jgi:hypothetical protein
MEIAEYLRSAVAILPTLAKFAIGMALIVAIPREERLHQRPPASITRCLTLVAVPRVNALGALAPMWGQ